MKRLFLLVSILLVFASPAFAAGKPFDVALDWRNVVPAGSGDANVFGDATVYVSSGQGQLCWEIRAVYYASSWPPTGAFIHRGAAGENGLAVLDLGAPLPPSDSYVASGCASASSRLLKAIQQNPGGYYLQIVNETHPDGATRGQLSN
jgi:hypothetical protein